jgi:hypothetical protein
MPTKNKLLIFAHNFEETTLSRLIAVATFSFQRILQFLNKNEMAKCRLHGKTPEACHKNSCYLAWLTSNS